MPSKEKYDLIVVGAGPGGAAAAKVGADRGLDVLLIERAEIPGQKNMSGSTLFKDITEEIFPGFCNAEMNKGNPTLGNFGIKWATDNDEHEFSIGVGPGSDTMANAQLVDRSVSDEWLANEAVKAGAELMTSTRVDDLIWDFSEGFEKRRCIGVITEKGEKIYADAVADCSGLHSEIARRSGLMPRHSMTKVQFAVKLIMQWTPDMDDEVKRRMGYWVDRDGNDVCDWMKLAVIFGAKPDYFACHSQAIFSDRVVEVVVYEALQECFDNDFNIWQRVDWYLDVMDDYLHGMTPIHVNFHSLNAFDIVGYDGYGIQLPGLFLVGDAAAYCNPVDSWGANVALWMGKLAANLLADMKKDNDYSPARFAAYQTACENDWVGDDALHASNLSKFLRGDRFTALWDGIDAMATSAVHDKFTCKSYAELLPKAVGKMLPYLGTVVGKQGILETVYPAGSRAFKTAEQLMSIVGKIKD